SFSRPVARATAPKPRNRAPLGAHGLRRAGRLLHGGSRRHAARSPGSAQGHASKYAGQSWPWPALQGAFGRRRPDRVRPRLKMGLEGIVSKRKESMYRSGRSPDWLKMKNSDAPAVTREAEEEWSKRGRR